MRFGILGPLRAGDGETTVTAGRDRTVLALLLLHAGQVVPVDDLVDAVWEDDPPATARGQLQTCVSRLRRTLATGSPDEVIVTGPEGYLIRAASPAALDAVGFAHLAEQARALVARDRPEAARDAFRDALALWRGPALAGFSAAAIRRGAAALEEERLRVIEECVDVELGLGRERELLSELTDLVDRHPLRERLRGQLMTALCGAGRQADALAVFRQGRELLAGELGIEPGAALQRLHQRILAGEVECASDRPTVRCLPRAISDFTGREDAVRRLIEETGTGGSAVHVIDGMAGSGKTTLALHVANALGERYPDAHLFIDLHGHSPRDPVTPTAALASLLRQLGLPGEQIPADFEDRVGLWRDELSRRRALVVLDNAASTAQVSPLLPAGPGCLTLVTSRRRLVGLDGVRPRSLAVLEPREAVALLARVAGPERVGHEPVAAAEVVRRCGYLPLAIRLAGARLAHRPGWRVADLARRLQAGGPVLAEFAAEHRSVADAFALSYAQVAPPAQRMFRLLGLHPGERFDACAAAALTELPLPQAQELLDALVDGHLVEEPAAGRYRFHDLVREYARELLASTDTDADRQRAIRSLLDFYLNVAAHVAEGIELPPGPTSFALNPGLRPDLVGECGSRGREWLETERPTLVALVGWAVDQKLFEYAWRLARTTWRHSFLTGHLDDIVHTHLLGLRAAEALGDDHAIASMHNYLASAYYRSGQLARSVDSLLVVLGLRERLGDLVGQTAVHSNLAGPLAKLGRVEEAEWHLLRARELAWQSGNLTVRLSMLANTGFLYIAVGRYREALRVLRTQAYFSRQLGDHQTTATAMGKIGVVRARMGHHEPALRRLHLAVRLMRAIGNRAVESEMLNEIGLVERARGRPHDAAARHRDSLVGMGEVGDPGGECAAWNGLGRALLDLGDAAGALALHQRALRAATKIQYRYEQANALAGIAACLVSTDPEGARSHWNRALELFREIGSPGADEVRRRLAELG